MPLGNTGLSVLVWLVIVIALWVAVDDFLYMRIPNAAHVLLALVFGLFVVSSLTWGDVGARLGVAAAVFTATFLLHIRGAMGAGDVKFLAVSALFVPTDPITIAAWLMVVAIAGPLVFALHRLVGLIVPGNRFPSFSEAGFFPYGPAISIGLVTVVAVTGPPG